MTFDRLNSSERYVFYLFIQVGGEQENVANVPHQVSLTSSTTTQQAESSSAATQSAHESEPEDSLRSQNTLPTITTVNGEYIKVENVSHCETCSTYMPTNKYFETWFQ